MKFGNLEVNQDRNNFRNKLPKYVTKSASDDLLDKSANEAAGEVQKLWRGHFASNEESTNRASATTLQKPSTRPKSAPTARRVIVEQGEQSQGGK